MLVKSLVKHDARLLIRTRGDNVCAGERALLAGKAFTKRGKTLHRTIIYHGSVVIINCDQYFFNIYNNCKTTPITSTRMLW